MLWQQHQPSQPSQSTDRNNCLSSRSCCRHTKACFFSHHQRKLIPTETEQKCFVSILSDLSMRFLQRHQVPPPTIPPRRRNKSGKPRWSTEKIQSGVIDKHLFQTGGRINAWNAWRSEINFHAFFSAMKGIMTSLWVSFEFPLSLSWRSLERMFIVLLQGELHAASC